MTAPGPASQNAPIESGLAHAPVTSIKDPEVGAPATQLHENDAMPIAFGGACIESAGDGLKPRIAPVLSADIDPGREAPRKPDPGARTTP